MKSTNDFLVPKNMLNTSTYKLKPQYSPYRHNPSRVVYFRITLREDGMISNSH